MYAPVSVLPEDQGSKGFGVVTDVSYGGLFIQTPSTYECGRKVQIDFPVEGVPVRMTGTVMRRRVVDQAALVKYAKGGIGISIESMHPTVIDYINRRLTYELRSERSTN